MHLSVDWPQGLSRRSRGGIQGFIPPKFGKAEPIWFEVQCLQDFVNLLVGTIAVYRPTQFSVGPTPHKLRKISAQKPKLDGCWIYDFWARGRWILEKRLSRACRLLPRFQNRAKPIEMYQNKEPLLLLEVYGNDKGSMGLWGPP